MGMDTTVLLIAMMQIPLHPTVYAKLENVQHVLTIVECAIAMAAAMLVKLATAALIVETVIAMVSVALTNAARERVLLQTTVRQHAVETACVTLLKARRAPAALKIAELQTLRVILENVQHVLTIVECAIAMAAAMLVKLATAALIVETVIAIVSVALTNAARERALVQTTVRQHAVETAYVTLMKARRAPAALKIAELQTLRVMLENVQHALWIVETVIAMVSVALMNATRERALAQTAARQHAVETAYVTLLKARRAPTALTIAEKQMADVMLENVQHVRKTVVDELNGCLLNASCICGAHFTFKDSVVRMR